jgi:predicted permease
MIRNYLKIAFRNLQKNTIYSFLNIFGLAIGITASLLILLWVHNEMTYDGFHENKDQLYQVMINATYDEQINTWSSVPFPTAEALADADSRIKHSILTDYGAEHLLTVKDVKLNPWGHCVDKNFLEMFKFPLMSGAANRVLDDNNSIVLTESMAKKLFKDEDPLNKIIRIDNEVDVKVTGILKDLPRNSSWKFEYLLSLDLFTRMDWVKSSMTRWNNYSFAVYVELHPGAGKKEVEAQVKDLLAKNGQTDIKREFILHGMPRWRLYSNFEDGVENGGAIEYVAMFLLIGVFILLIACINFMNLATARSERRAKEVGIRKSVGSSRMNIVFQFLGESILISLIAFLCALAMTELSLPLYNSLIDTTLSIDYGSVFFWMMAIGIVLITGVLAGSYPAFYLSSFSVSRVLKGRLQTGRSGAAPRKVLVVFQFVLAISLIVGTIVIQRQIEHVKNRDLGYNQENLITVPATAEVRKFYKSIKHDLIQSGVVEAVTKSNSPVTGIYSNNFVDWPGKPESQRYSFATIAAEYDYTKTMGIKMLMGRDFSEDFKTDSSAIIINQAGADLMGLADPIGREVTVWNDKRQIIGVVDDVLMGSAFHEISPMFIVLIPDWASAVTIRLSKTKDLQASLKKVEAVFRKHNPAYPFQYTFVDDEFAKKFAGINMISTLGGIFTFLAIVITGLGLFGLAAFTAEQRTKEVGIRKVLGASVANLVVLIIREFTILVLVAFAFAGPVSWWLSGELLERYPYRVDVPYWVIPIAGGVALVFTLIVVSTQAFRAATTNPVHSLRSE